jgi:hypothetical protein
MQNIRSSLALVIAGVSLLSACADVGVRRVARPSTPQGYKQVDVKDITLSGVTDQYVELVTNVEQITSHERCNGIIMVTTPQAVTANKQTQVVNGEHTVTTTTVVVNGDNANLVTLTLPRTRFAEVKDLQAGDRVRVRGYASQFWTEGCDWHYYNANRAVWIDTIEKLP